jgi:hypothetical protein
MQIRRVTTRDYNQLEDNKSFVNVINSPLSIELCVLSVLAESETGSLLGYASIADRFGKSLSDPAPYDSLIANVQECVVDAIVSVSLTFSY